MTKIKPLGRRVLIKRTLAQKTKGGIILPDTAQEKPKQGEVVAVGPGKTEDDGTTMTPEVCVGDTVLFGAYAGTEVKDEGEEFLIMSEDDILGVLTQG